MNELPNPLTPADCDLTGYRWMPLDVIRVIDSDTFGISTGDEFKTAFRLWAKSWQQVPAASLPDDDRVLAHLAGLSENLPKWKKVRAVALRGFIKCSDGRLYHPVIAEKAIEAMGKREAHVEREESEQSRQQRYRERRKQMFETLRAHGIVVPMSTKMDELERLVASLPASPTVTDETKSVTESVTDETPGDVTHDASATSQPRAGHGYDMDTDMDSDKDSKPKGSNGRVGDSDATCVRATPGALSAAMRKHGVNSQPGDPRIQAAADAGMTVETITAATLEAKGKKPNEAIKPGYVLAIANAWHAEASAPKPAAAAQQPRLNPEEQRRAVSDANAAAWLASTTPATDPNVIDMEH
ncbi:MAG: DUF1376 domain-containing protein [Paraburkholderia sp.]|uniref:DUF1376 domain-containing protein n=1 Tax=Paraburkholderia sp. TaxID=1926495 RepID=UPI00397B52C9